eukprot:TRINITY_DN27761_c0_g1_i1.p1 TRINITY_DN27761_c0_g1~~TRINITY_DN27761_c0_g1_i1.p1  ORF type:complete len:252 (+),score=40.04 TRINITY_DN27761_c0_g1_i1:44-799(+)
MASSSSAAGASAALGGKRPVADPRGPVLELLQGYGVTDRGYYDNKIRGKLLRFDNIKQLAAGSSGGRGKGAGRGSGYGGGRHRRAAEAAAEAQAEASGTAVGSSKAKGRERGFQYEDFGPLRDLWAAYMQDLRAGLGAGCDASALGELLASADLHGSTIEVVQATTPGCVRLRGTVIEETQRTFKIILFAVRIVFDFFLLWRTSRTPTRRHAPCSDGSGRRNAPDACRRSAGRCASARNEAVQGLKRWRIE